MTKLYAAKNKVRELSKNIRNLEACMDEVENVNIKTDVAIKAFWPSICFGVEKRNVGNSLKRIWAKFRTDPSHV